MLQPSDIDLGVDSDGDEPIGDSELGDSEPDEGQRTAVLGVDSDGDEHLGDSEPDEGQRTAVDGFGGAAPAPAGEESDGDGDDGGFYDSDEEKQHGRRRECELLISDLGPVRDCGPGWKRSRLLSLKLLAGGEHQDRARLHNHLAHGVMPAYGVLPKSHLLALPLADLIRMNAEVEERIRLLVWCHRRGIGCPACSYFNHAAPTLAVRLRGYNRSATRRWQGPDFWPQQPF